MFAPRFHCEGRIVSTLFGLLFWDILFADIPGAFETEYQSAPLDIAEDCFYYAREGLIKERLGEIEEGKAQEIVEKVDEEHRAKATLCVGVRWDLFTREDLLEIVDVSHALHISCSSTYSVC
jgi:Fanconi-associated nuclease 1